MFLEHFSRAGSMSGTKWSRTFPKCSKNIFWSPCRSPGGGISGPALGFSRLPEAYVNAIRTPIVLRTFFLCSKTIFGSETFSGRVYSPAGTVSRCSNLPPRYNMNYGKRKGVGPFGEVKPPPSPSPSRQDGNEVQSSRVAKWGLLRGSRQEYPKRKPDGRRPTDNGRRPSTTTT